MTNPDDLSFGQRLRVLRERAGKSRPVLGGLVGRSGEWVKALETGRMLTPRMPTLIRLAEALGVNELTELTGSHRIPVGSITKAAVPGTESVLAALLKAIPTVPAHPPAPVARLTGKVDLAWQVWHHSSTERSAIAGVLPDLVADARASVLAADGSNRRRALVEQARVYHLVQLLAAYQPADQLAWLAADRAFGAAQDADNPVALAVAAWYYAHIYRASGQVDLAVETLTDAVSLLQLGDDADVESRAVWGQLHLGLALSHAKAGRAGDALHHWDLASGTAHGLPPGYHHPWLLFGPAAVDAYRVTIETDLVHPGEAEQAARQVDHRTLPSQTRRAFYLIELARLRRMDRDEIGTVHMLERAVRQSLDTVRHHPTARGAVVELIGKPGVVGQDARDLALAIGLEG